MTTIADKTDALATCFRNLKGSKTKELLLTARALGYLRTFPEYSSNRRLGKAVGVSGEIVRQFVGLLDLPENVQLHFDEGSLGLEQGRRLWQLNRTRPELVEDAAAVMKSLTAMETRDLVEYLLRVPSSSVRDAQDALRNALPAVSHEYHIDAVLSEESYRRLQRQAKAQGLGVNDLVSTIVDTWLTQAND